MSNLPVIFFDANEGTHAHGYFLILPQSLRDLEALGSDLRDGLEVVIHSPNELEMRATLGREREKTLFGVGGDDMIWVAYPIAGTTVYLDGSDPDD